MKLVIKQYLASLKERGELDALLPDLLSQMGLEVFLKPGVGSRQYGVDVGAYGKIDGGSVNKVYLFSVKSGDLGRKDWDSGNPQDLRQSINEIIDVFIPSHIPSEYKNEPVEICLCFGGDVKEEVRANVSLFLERQKTSDLSFSEWNGDRLAALVEKFMLREELLPEDCRGLLRKSLAMIDEPEISFKHFSQLTIKLTNVDDIKPKKILMGIRQLYLCLWILYSWSREQNNIESAFLSAEFVLLNAWDASKFAFAKKNKVAISTLFTLDSILRLNVQISGQYVNKKIIPYADNLYALSQAVRPSCAVDVNIKLFDILGRLALSGCWAYWYLDKVQDKSDKNIEQLSKLVTSYQESIKRLIVNNPILFTPYKDDQAIDLALAVWFLSLDAKHWNYINSWLVHIANRIYQSFKKNDKYPSTLNSYSELIEHPIDNSSEYLKSVTKGSVLYPVISIYSSVLGLTEPHKIIKKLKQEFLEHCNFQVFFFDKSSEEHFYRYNKMHGATLSHVCIDEEPSDLVDQIEKECEESNEVYEMSALKYSYWPVILTGCRHYRLPMPMHFAIDIHKQRREQQEQSSDDIEEVEGPLT